MGRHERRGAAGDPEARAHRRAQRRQGVAHAVTPDRVKKGPFGGPALFLQISHRISHRVSHRVSHRREGKGGKGKKEGYEKTRDPLRIAGFLATLTVIDTIARNSHAILPPG